MRDTTGSFRAPVQSLMCSDVRMSGLLTEARPIHRKEMPLFLSILHEVVDRWYEAVGRMNPDIYASYEFHANLVKAIQESYDVIANDDSSNVFSERENLGRLMENFSEMLGSFSRAFTAPPELKRFYHDILKRVDMTNEVILEGKHGW